MLEDHSLGETAAHIGISVSVAKARVFHAKAALRKSRVLVDGQVGATINE
jgi:DNA-directed RNA polymerase specialized sigma24 family protein